MKKLNNISIFLSFSGACFALAGFLMGLEIRGFTGMTVYFQLPILIFCFGIFCFNLVDSLRHD